MMHFTVSDFQPADSCHKCCCEQLALKPGTINRIVVSYAPWAVPIGRLHCDPSFSLEQMDTCPQPVGSNLPPELAAEQVELTTAINTPLTGTLTTHVTDPESAALTFKALPLYGPKHGKLVLQSNGSFTYTPAASYKGQDSFFASASDGVNTLVFEVLVAVGIEVSTLVATPAISIDPNGVQVDERYYLVSFPVKVSPAAKECEVWRLTVLQGALDCSCICYARSDCFDIRIIKC